jgi:hypothetical protein
MYAIKYSNVKRNNSSENPTISKYKATNFSFWDGLSECQLIFSSILSRKNLILLIIQIRKENSKE